MKATCTRTSWLRLCLLWPGQAGVVGNLDDGVTWSACPLLGTNHDPRFPSRPLFPQGGAQFLRLLRVPLHRRPEPASGAA